VVATVEPAAVTATASATPGDSSLSGDPAPVDDAALVDDSGRPDGSGPLSDVGGHHAHSRGRAAWSRWKRLRWAGSLVLVVWGLALATLSTVVYHRNFLAEDFAQYNQAWTLIGQGHLNPFDTVYGYPFVKSDFELIMWPLALLHLVTTQSVVLLWIQALAIAGTGIVSYVWITEYLERKELRRWPAFGISAAVLAVVIVNPGVYRTLQFDFHMEPLATFFLVLAGRDRWHGRLRRPWVWVAAVLSCGSFAAVMVVGLGLSALLAGRPTRRTGLLLIGAGAVWTGLISVLHANQGSGIEYYAYLAGRTTVPATGGVVIILAGMIAHPWRVTDHLFHRLGDAYTLIKPVGVIGLASAWGFGVPVTVMTVDALDARTDFLRDSYQNFAVFPFVLLGTVMVLVWVAHRVTWGRVVSLVVGALVLAQALVWGYTESPGSVRWTLSQVAPATGTQLRAALALTPADAETIVSLSVMGRFCGRQWCYFFYPDGARPVHSRHVVFVFATANEPLTTPVGVLTAVAYVQNHLHARVLVDADNVVAFEWTPPPGTTEVTIPTAATPG
jgi:Predicted membrane protein (DUF2079)